MLLCVSVVMFFLIRLRLIIDYPSPTFHPEETFTGAIAYHYHRGPVLPRWQYTYHLHEAGRIMVTPLVRLWAGFSGWTYQSLKLAAITMSTSCFAIWLLLLYRLNTAVALAAAITGIFAFPGILGLQGLLLSHIDVTLAMPLALYALYIGRKGTYPSKRSYLHCMAAGLVCGLAITAHMSFIPAALCIGAAAWRRHGNRAALFLAGVLIGLMPWLLWQYALGSWLAEPLRAQPTTITQLFTRIATIPSNFLKILLIHLPNGLGFHPWPALIFFNLVLISWYASGFSLLGNWNRNAGAKGAAARHDISSGALLTGCNARRDDVRRADALGDLTLICLIHALLHLAFLAFISMIPGVRESSWNWPESGAVYSDYRYLYPVYISLWIVCSASTVQIISRLKPDKGHFKKNLIANKAAFFVILLFTAAAAISAFYSYDMAINAPSAHATPESGYLPFDFGISLGLKPWIDIREALQIIDRLPAVERPEATLGYCSTLAWYTEELEEVIGIIDRHIQPDALREKCVEQLLQQMKDSY